MRSILLRFFFTLITAFTIMLVTVFFVAPRSFVTGRGVVAAWVTAGLVSLGVGILVSLLELAINSLAPRRGRFDKREERSVFDYWPW